jgi:hypothetical protein
MPAAPHKSAPNLQIAAESYRNRDAAITREFQPFEINQRLV